MLLRCSLLGSVDWWFVVCGLVWILGDIVLASLGLGGLL